MARKYIVASLIILRTNAENPSVLFSRYVYQMMTRNADSSKCFPRSAFLGVLGQQLGRTRILTERSTNRIRDHLEPMVYDNPTQFEGIDREWRKVYDRWWYDEGHCERHG